MTTWLNADATFGTLLSAYTAGGPTIAVTLVQGAFPVPTSGQQFAFVINPNLTPTATGEIPVDNAGGPAGYTERGTVTVNEDNTLTLAAPLAFNHAIGEYVVQIISSAQLDSYNEDSTGALLAANNLSDVANAGSSRANIHVPVLTPAAAVATSNISIAAPGSTVDGYSFATGDAVLLVAQSTPSQNGVWSWNGASSPMTRPTEFATGLVIKGRFCAILNGNVNANTTWLLDAPTTGITVDTSSQVWSQSVAVSTTVPPTTFVGALYDGEPCVAGDVVLQGNSGSRVLVTEGTAAAPNYGTGYPPILSTPGVALSPPLWYAASDFGVVADGVTDNSGALNRLIRYVWQEGGGYIQLPPGGVAVASTVIMLSNTFLVGCGITTGPENYTVLNGAGASQAFDTVSGNVYINTANPAWSSGGSYSQYAQVSYGANPTTSAVWYINLTGNNNSALTPATDHLNWWHIPNAPGYENAFAWGLMNLEVHGNNGFSLPSPITSWNHCVSHVTYPGLSAGTGDTDFDPHAYFQNVYAKYGRGNGFWNLGRSGDRYIGCWAGSNSGDGFRTSFDTEYVGCHSVNSGLNGFYMNHASCRGAANKSYNNGRTLPWVSGGTYAAGAYATSAGVLYVNITGTNTTTAPASDTTNWLGISTCGAGGGGFGFYWDTNGFEHAWSGCDSQQNSGGSYYVAGYGNNISGTSYEILYNNGVQWSGNYADVCLDGTSSVGYGNVVAVSCLHTASTGYVLRLVDGATHNDVTLAGDTTAAATLTPDSTNPVGSGNNVFWNGAAYGLTATEISASGLTGATAASRYVGATTSGAPVSGTFAVGDWIVDRTGHIYVCTTAGTPGTWTSVGGAGTVTSASVASANGFAGTVANPTTTPAITVSTTINATVLSGNGTAISAATTTGTGTTVVLSGSPALTGTPTVPTASPLTNSTQAASTAYTDAAVAVAAPAAAPYLYLHQFFR